MADDEDYTFDESGAKRVVNAVRFVEGISQGSGVGLVRRDGLINARPQILTGSLATDLQNCSALFNVDIEPFCQGRGASPNPDQFLPTQVTVYRYRRWLPGSLASTVLYAAGTNGTAMWLPNKVGYAFVPDCSNVSAEDPSDTSDPSEDPSGGGHPVEWTGAGFYCVCNAEEADCSCFNFESEPVEGIDYPEGYHLHSGPYLEQELCEAPCNAV